MTFRHATLVALLAVASGAWGAESLKLCGDSAGWPPYTYADPAQPARAIGASVELISEVLSRAGFRPSITLLPWSRCLAEVESGQFAIALDVTTSPEREARLLFSAPYYSIASALYYSRQRFPQPPRVERLDDLPAYRYCGLFGYNYTMYAIPENRIDTGAKSEASRFEKLQLGRCDFLIGDIEILDHLARQGVIDLADTARLPIPGASPKQFHVAISRALPGAEALRQRINDGLAAAHSDRTVQRIFRKHGLASTR